MANKITTVFDADTRSFQTGVKSVKKSIAEADGAFGKMRAGWKASIGEFRQSNVAQGALIAGLGAAALKSIGYASDLEESINAVQVTFGDAAEAVLKIGENSAEAFGMSKSEFNSMAVSFAAFAQQVAGPGGDVAGTIEDLSTRVADFASVMNLDLATATQVFQSSLAGQTEPIRRYGKDISAAAVEHYALANGLAASKSEMTEAIKVQARYGLLMEQTDDVAGDFANTSDGLANSQRILSAEAKDLAAEVGEALVPAMESLVEGMRSLITVAEAVHLDEVLGIPAEMNKAAEHVGRSLRALVDSTARANMEIEQTYTRGAKAAGLFDRAQLEGLTTFEQVRQKVLDLTRSEHAANLIALEWAKSQEELGVATVGATDAAGGLDDAVVSVSDNMSVSTRRGQEAARAMEAKAAADQDAADAAQEHADAISDLVDEVDDLLGNLFDYEEASIQLGDAVSGLADKTGNELRLATIGAARDALSASEAFATEQGALKGTSEFAALQRGELVRLREQYPALRGEIDAYIDALSRIPRDVNTTVRLSGGAVGTTNAAGQVTSRTLVGSGMTALAEGGIVTKPTVALVGESGAEAVIPLNKMGGGVGGSPITINVTAGLGADGAQIGRLIRDELLKLKRATGNLGL